jgi:hypothetical protein
MCNSISESSRPDFSAQKPPGFMNRGRKSVYVPYDHAFRVFGGVDRENERSRRKGLPSFKCGVPARHDASAVAIRRCWVPTAVKCRQRRVSWTTPFDEHYIPYHRARLGTSLEMRGVHLIHSLSLAENRWPAQQERKGFSYGGTIDT